jgi:hypothetical protein
MGEDLDTTIRIQRISDIKLEKISKRLGLTKKRTMEMFIDLGCRLHDKMNGYHSLLFDDRLQVKFYFDSEKRDSIEF